VKLFRHSQGFVVAFGFDMVRRQPAPRLICWSDPSDTSKWEPAAANEAGYMALGFDVEPEFVREVDGVIVAYQPGICVEMTHIGPPYVWSVRILRADTT
jgi:hypothetical protein